MRITLVKNYSIQKKSINDLYSFIKKTWFLKTFHLTFYTILYQLIVHRYHKIGEVGLNYYIEKCLFKKG